VPTVAPPPPPALITASALLVRASTTDLTVTLPSSLERDQAYVVRVYVNDSLVREQAVLADAEFKVRNVPLEQGANEIAAALATTDREGVRSAPVTVTRDDIAPVIRVSRPQENATVYGPLETLRGRTEAGAAFEVVVQGTGEVLSSTVAPDGRFEAPLPLEMGENVFDLHSQDPAGNRASTRLVVTRAVSLASINIDLSEHELTTAQLPTTVRVVAQIRDELGVEVDGADVTFSVSPPNRATTVYRAVSSAGIARWPELVVSGDQRAVGAWLVTVLVSLPSGGEIRGDATITVTQQP
jgi:hypothetical protein